MKFETYLVILFSAHPFDSRPFSLLVVGACILHGVQTANSCRGLLIDSYSPSGNFVLLLSPHSLEGAWWGQQILELRIFCGAGVRYSTNLVEQVLRLPLWSHPSDLCQSVPGRGYNFPPFVDLKYIQLLDVGKLILNSEEFLHFPSLEYLKPLCSLIYGPTLHWLMCLSNFALYLQLFHSLFVLVFFLSSWAHDLPILLSMFESLTFYRYYYFLEFRDNSRQIDLLY